MRPAVRSSRTRAIVWALAFAVWVATTLGLVHGTLHAQGYEHETNEKDALEMEALEVLLMGALGYENPYE